MSEEHEPLVRVMALHALAYCERLFYLEEVEEIRVADASVYAGRALHDALLSAEDEGGERVQSELVSERLGLIGKADCLRRIDGSLIPYEHKRGKPQRQGKKAEAWPSDSLQVSAYGMLLEEETGRSVPEGRIRYHGENVTVRVRTEDSGYHPVGQVIVPLMPKGVEHFISNAPRRSESQRCTISDAERH